MPTETLTTVDLTYAEVGATRGALPPGYHHLEAARIVGHGRDWFDVAAQRVLTWEVQRRAGIAVDVERPVVLGVRAVLRVGPGRLRISAPVEVVEVASAADLVAFAYGTLAGHPERGEERFEVTLLADGSVLARVRAFSVAGRWFARLAGPVGRRLQGIMAQRYLDALTQPRGTTSARRWCAPDPTPRQRGRT